MKIYVFVGPTISVDHARQYLDATYCPPVQQGDVLSVLRDEPDAICIIDGYFEGVPSVWHKEILAALAGGVHVFGAASMGALRAAELHCFGMKGIGRVFDWYKTGFIEDDDEVVVKHASAEYGFRQLSEAMVNIRDAFEVAGTEGIVTPQIAARLVEIAKGLHYADRCYPLVLEAARRELGDFGGLEELAEFLQSPRLTLKQRDAIELLQHVAQLAQQPPAPFSPSFRIEHTTFLDSLLNDVSIAEAPEERGGAVKLQARKYQLPDLQSTDLAFLRVLARQHARRIGLELSDLEIKRISSEFVEEFGGSDKSSNGSSPEAAEQNRARARLISDLCLIEKLREIYRKETGSSFSEQTVIANQSERKPPDAKAGKAV